MLVRKNKLARGVVGVLIAFIASAAWAASPQDLRFDVRSLTALQKQGSNPSDAAIRSALGLTSDDALEVVRAYSDDRGGNVTRYRQKFRGVPVWGEQIVVSKDRTGKITTLHGRRVAGIGGELRELRPAFSDEQALGSMQERVRSRMGITEPVYANQRSELVIYIDNNVPKLSYAVSFFADSPSGGIPTRPTFILDAVSGEIIHEFEGLTHQAANCTAGCELLNRSPLGGSRGTWQYFSVTVPSDIPAGAQLEITASGGSGDADMYVRKGTSRPSLSTFDCRPYLGGNNEQCIFPAKAGEQWTIGLYAYRSFSNLSLIAKVKQLTAAQATGPGGNKKTGLYQYGTNIGKLDIVTENGSACILSNANVKTVNLNHGTSGSTAFSFAAGSGNCNNTVKTINDAYSPLNDAHYFGTVVFNMYQAYLSTAPLTFPLTMRVHYSTGYENAFWDGSAMTFGDGASTFYPLVSLDVSSHEVSHGYTEQNSNLIYSGQSGGINEAFSDMAGEAAEYYMTGLNGGTSRNDFLVGWEIFKAGDSALRDMCNPPADRVSIDNAANYYDGMDVHHSSGVFNKAFCLLAKSSADGWNTQKAFQAFARANKLYWTPSTGFTSGAQAVVDAAKDLGYTAQSVVTAFAAVGISVSAGPTVPIAPTGLTATAASSSQINLVWTDASSNETGFKIERSSNGVDFAPLATVGSNVTSYSNTGLSASTSYSYRIQAYNATGSSTYSNTAAAMTKAATVKRRK